MVDRMHFNTRVGEGNGVYFVLLSSVIGVAYLMSSDFRVDRPSRAWTKDLWLGFTRNSHEPLDRKFRRQVLRNNCNYKLASSLTDPTRILKTSFRLVSLSTAIKSRY